MTQDILLDQSLDMMESQEIMETMAEKRGPTKKRVVPNNNQDKWLVYLLEILNQASELPWVEELLG